MSFFFWELCFIAADYPFDIFKLLLIKLISNLYFKQPEMKSYNVRWHNKAAWYKWSLLGTSSPYISNTNILMPLFQLTHHLLWTPLISLVNCALIWSEKKKKKKTFGKVILHLLIWVGNLQMFLFCFQEVHDLTSDCLLSCFFHHNFQIKVNYIKRYKIKHIKRPNYTTSYDHIIVTKSRQLQAYDISGQFKS